MPRSVYPSVYALPVKPERLKYLQAVVAEEPEAQLLTLARGLASSPLWASVPAASIVIRVAPTPLLGIIGYLDEAAQAKAEGLHDQLELVLPRLRYISYAQAEKDCELLAARLLDHFGPDDLRKLHFVAIPRGGFIVLAMLAYILGLQRSQLEIPQAATAPLVVVDDCSLSGLRFAQFLQTHLAQQVVFAHLYSHPALRAAITSKEERVLACFSAHDLTDYAPQRQGEKYTSWQQRWLERMANRAYWVGQTDHICFAWSEPDLGIWNPVTEQEEEGWRFVPPELCLKNRRQARESSVQVQLQPKGKGPLQPGPHVLFASLDEEIIVGNALGGESLVLKDVAADIWRAVIKEGNIAAVVSALVEIYDVAEQVLQRDIEALVNDLLLRGFLIHERTEGVHA